MKREGIYNLIILAALIGALVSGYLSYNHYFQQAAFCLPGQEAACDIVLKGPYATRFGNIPNALIGLLGFGLIFFLGLSGKKGNKKVDKPIFFLSLLATLFVVYLAYLIFFVIKAFCIWCFVAWICIITIFISSWIINNKRVEKAVARRAPRRKPARKTKRKVKRKTRRRR